MSCDFCAANASKLQDLSRMIVEAQLETKETRKECGTLTGYIGMEAGKKEKSVSFYEMATFYPRLCVDMFWAEEALANWDRACTTATNLLWLATLDLGIDFSHLHIRNFDQIAGYRIQHISYLPRRTEYQKEE